MNQIKLMANINDLFRAVTGAIVALALMTGATFANPSILFDIRTGKVLEHEQAFQRWHPASLTKLMTAYVTFRAIQAGELKLNSPIKMTRRSTSEPPSKMGFKPGSVMTLDNALKMMLIKSANDVAMAVAENVGGSEAAFVARMNETARRLGMTNTRFANPNGLHAPDQYTTAHDLALLVMAIRNEFPKYTHYFAIVGLSAGKKKLMSYNLLVGRFAGADGMKTGFICESGFNLIASATRRGRSLAVVVLGRESGVDRADAAAALLERGFASNSSSGATVATLPVYGTPDAPPTNMRAEICEKKPAAKSENSVENSAKAVKSPWRQKIVNPVLVAVGLGGATGPVPIARLNEAGAEVANVPIPTPRPDYAPGGSGATAQGDTAAGGD